MTVTESNRPSVIINWVARIIGLIVVVVFLVFIIGDTVDTMQQGNGFDVESLLIILPIVLALAGYILGWWHKVIGGSLLILVSIILGILIAWAAQRFQGPMSDFHAIIGWLILGLPFLVTGALLLISAYFDRGSSS
jgi:ABC-type Fe3+ transport system permease subunit